MDKRLSAFLAVARHHSTTAASAVINLSQSSVTKRIASLEAELGTPLFVRDRRGMTLTQAGMLLFSRAMRIEREYRDGIEEISTIAEAGLYELKVGAGPVFHLNWVAELFVQLKSEFPELKLDLDTQSHEQPGRSLIAGILDVYLGVIPDEELDESIYTKYITQVEHGIVLCADDPHAQGAAINPAQLAGYSWVSFVVDPVTESSIERYTLPEGTSKSLIDIRTTSFATGIQLVKTGQFVMSAPLQLAPVVEKDGLVIRPFQHRMPQRNAGLHVRKSALGYGAIQSVISYFDWDTHNLV